MKALVVMLLACGVARADALDEAQSRFKELEYEAALKAARVAAGEKGATHEQQVKAHALAGEALAVLDRKDEAVAEFEAVFALAPDFELPAETSPRILLVFRPARARWQVEQEQKLAMTLGAGFASLKVDLRLPTQGKGGSALPVGVELRDPEGLVDAIVLSYRREGQHAYSTLTAAVRGASAQRREVELEIPGAVTASREDYLMELHVDVRHRSGVSLRRFGDAEHPLSVRVRGGQPWTPKRVVAQWWLWTGIAAVAAVAIAVPIVVTRPVGPQHLELGGAP